MTVLNPKTIQESFYDLENFKTARHAPSAGTNRVVNGNNKADFRTRTHDDTVAAPTIRIYAIQGANQSQCPTVFNRAPSWKTSIGHNNNKGNQNNKWRPRADRFLCPIIFIGVQLITFFGESGARNLRELNFFIRFCDQSKFVGFRYLHLHEHKIFMSAINAHARLRI